MSGKTVVLLPTYNEKKNIARIIAEIFAVCPDVHVLVIDDNSPDGTANEVRALMPQFPAVKLLLRHTKQGLGEAYKAGMQEVLADGSVERVITMDADGSHAAEYLPALLRASRSYTLVIGSRYVAGGGIENWELWRYMLSSWGNVYARIIMGLPLNDLTAGFMCFHTSLLKRVDITRLQASGYAFLMELKFRAVRVLQCKVIEIPIVFKARREGESKISRHIISEGLLTPWRLRLNVK